MRIAISGMFWTTPHVGSGQYLYHLLQQFATAAPQYRFVLIVPRYRTRNVIWHKPDARIQTVVMPTPFDRRSHLLAKVWFEQIALEQASRKLRCDVLHVPYFAAPVRHHTPLVVTIHDLIPLLIPAYRGGRALQQYMRLVSRGARRANAVIADSEHTRQDIVQHLGIDARRIAVTLLAAGPELAPAQPEQIAAVRERFRLDTPYVLYLGGFQAHKNVATAIRAFARARPAFARRTMLAIAGRVPDTPSATYPDIHRVILDEGVAADVALLGAVSEAEKAALMSGAEAFVFPSRYEGFGLPPLEAMQCGAPTIASGTTSVGEAVGDGGLTLDPDDTAGWSAAITRVVNDAALRDRLRQRGRERAAQFRWETTAQQTIAVYEWLANTTQ